MCWLESFFLKKKKKKISKIMLMPAKTFLHLGKALGQHGTSQCILCLK